TTSSIGEGKAQCGPGPSRAFSPSPTGLPKRRIRAFSWVPTVKKPEARKTTTNATISTFTIAKLLLNASASASVPASSITSGGGGEGGGEGGGANFRLDGSCRSFMIASTYEIT